MRIVAQGIKKENIESDQIAAALGRYLTVIGEISAITETKTIHSSATMTDADGTHRNACNLNHFVIEDVRLEFRATGLARTGIENILESLLDGGHGFGGSIDRDLVPLHEVERPYIIESEDVVGVGVSEQDSIYSFDPKPQRLVAEIRRRINQDSLLA
jgi:hypothetical protein